MARFYFVVFKPADNRHLLSFSHLKCLQILLKYPCLFLRVTCYSFIFYITFALNLLEIICDFKVIMTESCAVPCSVTPVKCPLTSCLTLYSLAKCCPFLQPNTSVHFCQILSIPADYYCHILSGKFWVNNVHSFQTLSGYASPKTVYSCVNFVRTLFGTGHFLARITCQIVYCVHCACSADTYFGSGHFLA